MRIRVIRITVIRNRITKKKNRGESVYFPGDEKVWKQLGDEKV